MTIFADTSALIKLFVEEAGTPAMRALVAGRVVAVSDLAWAEAHATFGRRFRDALDTEEQHLEVSGRFRRVWPDLLRVPLHAAVLEAIPDLCRRHPLRAGDAIQLASALHLAREGLAVTLVCNDARLLAAAAAEGLEIVDPVGG